MHAEPGNTGTSRSRTHMPDKRKKAPTSGNGRTRSSTQCSYREGGRRCPYHGSGEPALCAPHRLALEAASRPRSPMERLGGAVIDFLQGTPINRNDTLGAVQEIFQQWSGTVGGQWHPPVGQPPPGSGSRPPWGPPPGMGGRRTEDPDLERVRAARRIMGFAESEPLTEEKISQRKRQLAKKHHPDRGGSAETMTAVNRSADILIAAL